jgi:hypothetical protein
MYFSRPDLKPLQIDLVTLEGGGSCPAQFWGKTTDGQEVYVRYRGGWLSVERGDETLLEAGIGPGLHGQMLLEQACDLTGLTVSGRSPPLSEAQRLAAAEQEDILDWSGRTTYWRRDFFTMTKEAGQSFVTAMQQRFSNLVLLELTIAGHKRIVRRREALAACGDDGLVVLGIDADAIRLQRLVASGDVQLADIPRCFATVANFSFGRNFGVPRLQQPYGELPDDELLRGSLGMQFATQDPAVKARVQEIVALAERSLPALIQPSR